jgi:hypothetical protein
MKISYSFVWPCSDIFGQRFLAQVKIAIEEGTQVFPKIEILSPGRMQSFMKFTDDSTPQDAEKIGFMERNIKAIPPVGPELLLEKFLHNNSATKVLKTKHR